VTDDEPSPMIGLWAQMAPEQQTRILRGEFDERGPLTAGTVVLMCADCGGEMEPGPPEPIGRPRLQLWTCPDCGWKEHDDLDDEFAKIVWPSLP
jgi:hypothetical protein